MNEIQKKKISKFLSLVLRHKPETIGLCLDPNGWADVDELIARCSMYNEAYVFSKEDLKEIVDTNDKQRFAFNETTTGIRASQGHSIEVDVEPTKSIPPEVLFHGTVNKLIPAIQMEGLKKMLRQHVHLSSDRTTAEKVGSRRGNPIILTIHSGQMYRAGFLFFLSANGVWLTDSVPAEFIEF